MSKNPWVKWYSADFLNGIADMDPNQIAVYSVVLNRIYDNEGPIDDDVERIARRCNMRPTSCKKALDTLVEAGKLIRRDGVLFAPVILRWEARARAEGYRRPIPLSVKEEVTKRDNHTCVYCGETDDEFEFDHVVPYSRGGTEDPSNIVLACKPCNRAKGARTPAEWMNG